MENHVERAVEGAVGVKRCAESVAETRKNWVAPELRKLDIAEVTANNSTMNASDGTFAS